MASCDMADCPVRESDRSGQRANPHHAGQRVVAPDFAFGHMTARLPSRFRDAPPPPQSPIPTGVSTASWSPTLTATAEPAETRLGPCRPALAQVKGRSRCGPRRARRSCSPWHVCWHRLRDTHSNAGAPVDGVGVAGDVLQRLSGPDTPHDHEMVEAGRQHNSMRCRMPLNTA